MLERSLTPHTREFPFPSEWFEISDLGGNVTAIREPHYDEDVLSYFIKGSSKSILIDSGMGLSDIRAVLPSTDLLVLLTHSHWDHMGGATDFPYVAAFSDSDEQDRVYRGWKPEEMVGFTPSNFIDIQIPELFVPESFHVEGVNLVMGLTNDQTIDLGNDRLRVIHTPGHTSGSACFLLEEQGTLFTGDTLYPGPEYLHMQGSNPEAYFASLEKLLRLAEDKLKVIRPGHNTTTADPDLLFRHVLAARGELPILGQEEGTDSFGPYTKVSYGDFSFLLPKQTTNS